MASETLHTSYEYFVGLFKIPKDKLEAMGSAAIKAKAMAYCKLPFDLSPSQYHSHFILIVSL